MSVPKRLPNWKGWLMSEKTTLSLQRPVASWASLNPDAAAHSSSKAQLHLLLIDAQADILALAAEVERLSNGR